ncbi:hypothetical protein BDV28DRAFT_140011, partial [Aspergillus coremiiformis]
MVRQLRKPSPLDSQQAAWLLQSPRRGRQREGRMLRFRSPPMRPEQHLSSWLELHWDFWGALLSPLLSPLSPPSQGAAVTTVAAARRAIMERNCIVAEGDFEWEVMRNWFFVFEES